MERDGVPRSLDPAQASSIYAKMLAVNLYDTLYRYQYLARPYQLAPNLAEGMPQLSADGLIYTIRIKPGVRFIDDPAFPEGKGRTVTAEDFVYSIKRHFDPAMRAQGGWLWQGRIVGLDLDGHDAGHPVHPGNARTVVAACGDGAGHMGAVAQGVVRVAAARRAGAGHGHSGPPAPDHG